MTTTPPPTWATDWDQDAQDAEWAAKQAAAKPAAHGGPWMVEDNTAGDQTFVDWLNPTVSKINEEVGWDGPDYTYLLKEAA